MLKSFWCQQMKKRKEKKISYLSKLKPFYIKHLKWLILVVFLSIVYAGIAFLTPVLEGQMLAYFTSLDFEKIIWFASFLLGALILKQFVTNFWSMTVLHLNSKVEFTIRQTLVNSIMRLKTKNFDEINSGILVTRLSRDTTVLAEFFDNITDDLSTVLMNVAFVVYSLFINVWIGLFLLLNLLILYAFNTYELSFTKKLKKAYREKDEQVIGTYTEFIRGIRDVKILDAGENMQQKINDEQLNTINAFKKQQHMRRTLNRYRDALQYTLDFVFILLSCYLLFKNNLTVSSLFIVILYKKNLVAMIKSIANIRTQIIETEISTQRVFEIMDEKNYQSEKFGKVEIGNLNLPIKFENVEFYYKKDKKIFSDLNFEITPNTLNAFVGKSGEGKSTIINLLTKSYDLISGKILFGEHEINTLSENTLRKNISVVSQNPYLFNMSIKQNLLLANQNATNDEIIEACKKAYIHSFIASKPNGYDEIVGENGTQLSGGQRQRIAIARALLKKSNIILFDEATSALDNKSQSYIKKIIKTLSKDHTIILISHRFSTIYDADKIFVLNNHQIEAVGTHEKLLKNNSTYQELYLADEEDKK